MADQAQKTEKPTPRRLREARRKGQLPRSVDLVQWSTLLVASFLVPSVIRAVLGRIETRLATSLSLASAGEVGSALAATATMAGAALVALGPILLLVVVTSIAGMAAQGGLVVSTDPLKPKLERVSPKAGLKRLFSLQSLVEATKAIVRLVVLTTVTAAVLVAAASEYLFTGGFGLSTSTGLLIDQVLLVLRISALIGTVIGLADYGFQRWQSMRRLRMTRKEVTDEQRNAEGDPMIRSRRRAAHAKLSRNKMLSAVGDASVVIVNPVHYAVALRYSGSDDGPVDTPEVVAKGTDSLAWRIRDRADGAGVPIIESPPLARALHATVDVGDRIPPEFYEAVAIVLAFVLRRRGRPTNVARRVNVPASKMPRPRPETDVEVLDRPVRIGSGRAPR